jgi:(R,R)-butanediol dehydrogenase / meso-butanediol dehydrogenase / diacetyl reductase
MKALRWHQRGDIRLDEIPEPSPRENEVKVRVKWCAICTSDIHELTDGPILTPVKKP